MVQNKSPKDQENLPHKKLQKQISEIHQRGKSRWGSVRLSVDRPPNWHIAVGHGRPVGRPSSKGERQFCTVGRPVGRPTKNREQMFSVGRPVGRPTDVHKRARPGHRTRSTGRSTVLAWNRKQRGFWTWENFQKYF